MKTKFIAICMYVGIMIIVFWSKPRILFDESGEVYEGFKFSKSSLSMGIFALALAVVVYFYATSNHHP